MTRDRERLSVGHHPEQDVAFAVTVQRARPVLVGCGDVHSGGLDGGPYSRQRVRFRGVLSDEEEEY